MRIKRGIIVVAVVAVLCGGYIAQGQIREKAAESVKKGAEAGKTAAQAVQKPADPAKKPADTTKTAAPKPAEDPEEKVIRASAETFTKLYNAHDAKSLAALFSPKAEMIDEDSQVVKGREAIEKTFVAVFKEHPKASMQVDVESVRVLTSMLAIEEGTARSKDSPDNPEDVTIYVAIHVKTDGKWQLACVRDWDAPAEDLSPHHRLEQNLAWLVGEWIDEGPDSDVHTVCKWHDNGNFLMQEFQVNVGGEIAMSGTMRIGWDAVAKQFKSWVFDSHGGHSTGAWLRDTDRWIIKMQGATAKGEAGSSTNYYRPIDKDTIASGSYDRVIDGERLEDIPEIIVKRRPPHPTE
jgi:uncharacterized protein (TIGR02246 family)